jgi:hypothetical protein
MTMNFIASSPPRPYDERDWSGSTPGVELFRANRSHLTAKVRQQDMDRQNSRRNVVAFWIATALFALQIGFTAYAQLRLPQVAAAFTHLGFPGYFRVQNALFKIAGIIVLLAPAPARLKEWAYAGFAIDLGSAVVAHVAVGDGPEAWGWAVGSGVLCSLSYFSWRRLPASALAPVVGAPEVAR